MINYAHWLTVMIRISIKFRSSNCNIYIDSPVFRSSRTLWWGSSPLLLLSFAQDLQVKYSASGNYITHNVHANKQVHLSLITVEQHWFMTSFNMLCEYSCPFLVKVCTLRRCWRAQTHLCGWETSRCTSLGSWSPWLAFTWMMATRSWRKASSLGTPPGCAS